MKPEIVTVGVYGFTEEAFFQSLVKAHIDTFCDVRLRRGMRGSTYAFVNSTSLQKRLKELNIRYVHFKELAPSQETRLKQKKIDDKSGTLKRTRTQLADSFIKAYEEQCLNDFDAIKFLETLGQQCHTAAIFCVEGEPEACHRSLVASRLAHDLDLQVTHLKP